MDSHEHEGVGSNLEAKDIDSRVARQALSNLLLPNPGAYPDWLIESVLSGIAALNFGDSKARHMFNKGGAGHKRRRTLAMHEIQLQAVAFVVCRREAYGRTEMDAATRLAV